MKATDIRQSARNLHLAMTLIFSELLRNPVFDSHLRYRKGIIKHENRELTSCSRKSAVVRLQSAHQRHLTGHGWVIL